MTFLRHLQNRAEAAVEALQSLREVKTINLSGRTRSDSTPLLVRVSCDGHFCGFGCESATPKKFSPDNLVKAGAMSAGKGKDE